MYSLTLFYCCYFDLVGIHESHVSIIYSACILVIFIRSRVDSISIRCLTVDTLFEAFCEGAELNPDPNAGAYDSLLRSWIQIMFYGLFCSLHFLPWL